MRSRQGLRRLITLTAVVGLLGMPLAQEARADDPISFTSPGNPIIADGSYYSADAAPLVVDDTLYIYAGHDEAGTQEGTFRMKDYGVYATDDVDSGDWKLYKANLTPATVFSWATGNGAYAGQTVEGDDGKFYWYVPVETKSTAYANRMAIGVAVSDSPTGPWTDALGEPLVDWGDVFGTSTSGQEIIDPHVFRDDDGSWYLYWGSWYVARAVELDTMTSWSGSISTLTGLSKFFEAPWVFKRGDTYYLAYDWKDGGSACTPSNYQACIAYATADNPLGPWSYQGIILAGTSATTVHPSIIEFDGSWYITYHTKDAVGGGHFRRSVAIDEVTWDGDKIAPVTPTLANDPLKTPMSNVARNAHVSATYTETPPMRLGAVNDGRQTTALLPPDQWGNYRSTTSTVESDSVTYRFDTPVRVDSAGVQFHRDSNWIRPPASWGIEYLDDSGAWTPVTATSAYPVSTTAWNEVTFQPVTTLALRATFNGQASGAYFNSVSVSEWEVNAVAPDSYVRGTATTAPGVAPVLPQAVRLKYGTETIWAPVTWLDVDPADYAAAGTFVAKGRALGYAAGLVDADVTVTTTPPVTPTDTTAPTASFALLGTQGSDGWFSSAVDATLVATDDVSYASTLEIKVSDGAWQDKGKGASAVQRITTAGNTTLSGRATDAAGNVSAVATATVKIDNVAPVGTAALDAETRATTLTASDAHSGVAKLEYRFQGGTWTAATAGTPIPAPDESPTTLTWRVTDKAGNQATGTVSVPPGDPSQLSGNIAPIAAPSVSYVTGWNSTDGLNDGSGAPLGDNEDELGVAWGTWPQVGEQTATLTWDFDATLDHVGVWWLSDSTDDANAGMIPPKSWVLQYLDGGEWKDVTLASGSAYGRERDAYNRVDFSAVTTRALRIIAQSWGESSGEGSVGILEWQAFTPESVSVDETAPTLTLTSAPAAPNGAAGWYTTPVTVTATAVDDVDAAPVVESRTGAGAWAAVTGPVTLSVEGVNAVEFRAVDASGNASAAQSVEARVDTVAPAVASSVAGHTVTLTATDATSGVASVEYRVDGGAWKAYSAPVAGTAGQKIEYRATDVAGNLAKASSVTLAKDPTPKPTTEPSGPVDVYSTPGFHNVGGRWWYTACEAYSQTERCRTEIWATTAEIKDGRVVKSTGWTFNNLTYLPLMTREQWKGNPLAESGTWTSNGRQWRTECDTAATGRGGCRSYIRAEYVAASKQADGSYTYRKVTGWVFNNQVRFR